MDQEAIDWSSEALRLCVKAKESGLAILLRNDDYQIIACSATDPTTITALGEALSCGYSQYSQEEE